MTRWTATSLAALALLSLSVVAPAADDDVAALVATDRRMQRAFVERDVATLEDIFTDDYVLVLWNGAERTRREVIAEVASTETKWETNETSGWQVRVHGDTAIVVAMLHQKGVDHGQPFDSNVRFSDTYVREHGRWRNVHAHASKSVPVERVAGT